MYGREDPRDSTGCYQRRQRHHRQLSSHRSFPPHTTRCSNHRRGPKKNAPPAVGAGVGLGVAGGGVVPASPGAGVGASTPRPTGAGVVSAEGGDVIEGVGSCVGGDSGEPVPPGSAAAAGCAVVSSSGAGAGAGVSGPGVSGGSSVTWSHQQRQTQRARLIHRRCVSTQKPPHGTRMEEGSQRSR